MIAGEAIVRYYYMNSLQREIGTLAFGRSPDFILGNNYYALIYSPR